MEKQMSRYKPYLKYKESGVEWLGDVPEHWILRKLKFFARIKNGQDQKKVIQDNGKYPIYGSGGEFGRANSYLYNQVSVLLGRKGTVDKPLFIAEPFWTVDTMYFTKINSLTNPRFFYYSCLTIPFGYYQYGSALPSMTQEDLHNHHFIAPPIKEQKAIANYLDQKTKKIDTLIEKQQTLIKLLKEKRQALISHAVTKGLDIDNNTWNKYRLDWVTTIVRGNTGFKKD
jgi:type I restriction enzyme S subunit